MTRIIRKDAYSVVKFLRFPNSVGIVPLIFSELIPLFFEEKKMDNLKSMTFGMNKLVYSDSKFDKPPNSVGIVPEKEDPIDLFETKALISYFRSKENVFTKMLNLLSLQIELEPC